MTPASGCSRRSAISGPYGGGGSGPGNNGPWGGPTYGGPFPSTPGTPNPGSNRGPGGRDIDVTSPSLREYTDPAQDITFTLKEGETDLADDNGQKRAFVTDGRKLQKSKDQHYREIAAHWEGSRLVSEEKDARYGRIRRSFELSGDNRQLDEYVSMEVDRSTVMIHYVYDIVPDRAR